MATCRDIITRAYAMAGISALGEDIDATELTAGLSVLQSIYDRIADAREYEAVVESGTYEAEENQRITGATSVNLPTFVVDCVTGEDRAPKDMAFVQYDVGAGVVTYACDRGSWVLLDGLTASSAAPFSTRNAEGLSALVALELSDTYPGAAVGPMTAQKARRWQSMFARQDSIESEYY